MAYIHKAESKSDEFSILIEGESVFIYTDCIVEEVKKVLTFGGKGMNSVVYVKPVGRGSDQIISYMHDFDNCDDKVIVAIQGK